MATGHSQRVAEKWLIFFDFNTKNKGYDPFPVRNGS
jgi:hypothetical protein